MHIFIVHSLHHVLFPQRKYDSMPSAPPLEEVNEYRHQKKPPPDADRRPALSAQMRPDTHGHVSDTQQLCPVVQLSPAVCKL